jgi:hypothetical protein
MFAFDTKSFLTEHFGSARSLIAFFHAYGFDAPSEAAADKWFQRASVPSDWFALIVTLLSMDRPEGAQLSRYLRSGK